MKLLLNRFKDDRDTTLGMLYINGTFECFTLEDEYRENKISGETRIPAGLYKIRVRKVGGFHHRYSRRFSDIHQGMLELVDVPNFKYILLHVGNTDEDTAGCILTGAGCDSTTGNMSVSQSVKAYKKVYKKVIQAAIDDDLTIRVLDNP